MMDLVIAMTPYVNEKNIGILYDMTVPWLQVGIFVSVQFILLCYSTKMWIQIRGFKNSEINGRYYFIMTGFSL